MKKILIALIAFVSLSVSAQHHHHGYGRGWNSNPGWWVAPALIGGAVVYATTRPQVVVQQPPVVVQQPPVVVQQPTDIVYIDGYPYRKQLMLINGAYQEVLIRM